MTVTPHVWTFRGPVPFPHVCRGVQCAICIYIRANVDRYAFGYSDPASDETGQAQED